QPEVSNSAFHIRFVLREGEFRRMYTDHRESLIAIPLVPGLHVWQRSNAVHTGVVPEIHQHRASAQLPEAEWQRIKPHSTDLRSSYLAFLDSHPGIDRKSTRLNSSHQII